MKKVGGKRRLQPCEVLGRWRWRQQARVSTRCVAAHLIRSDLKCRLLPLEIDPTRAEQRQTYPDFTFLAFFGETMTLAYMK